MKRKGILLYAVMALAMAASFRAHGTPASISVQVDKPSHPVSPLLWGAFFEDINLAADGGLYAEMVRNRSFEGEDELRYWTFSPAAKGTEVPAIDTSKPLNAFNRQSLRVRPGAGLVMENPGYWGMKFMAGEKYVFRIAARGEQGFNGNLRVELCGNDGTVLASGEIKLDGGDKASQPKPSNHDNGWREYSLELVPAKSDSGGKLKLTLSGEGTAFLDMISLMPEKSWKGLALRSDLANALDALKPAFLRFPGGCFVEGDDIPHSYNWKQTIGDVASRTTQHNLWGYLSTNGLGYHEYLQLAEDLGAQPVFCINVGMSHRESVPLDRMGAWVQDALDAIEYANGSVDSIWGSLRAKNGHPKPFNLRYIEIGNENGGPDYAERWPLFVKAIKAKYPDITLIANFWFDTFPKEPMPEIVDEHYYDTPEGLMRRAAQYDTYDRKGHKVFVGEYASTKRVGLGNLRAAVGEAAFMTGLERNSDVVVMAAYAPLFANVNHRTWTPDLINFDSAGWYGLPSYYVQQMFSLNTGDLVLPTEVESAELPPVESKGGIGVGTWNTSAEFKDIKVTAPDGKVLFASDFEGQGTKGWSFVGPGQWSVKGGILRQTAEEPNVRALIGDPSWKDYTVEMKARKISGLEGFQLLFDIQHEQDRTGWNLGGWDNKYYALSLDDSNVRKEGSIDAGHWYDVKVEIRDGHIRCWLDGKLIHDVQPPHLTTQTLYASATRDSAAGEIILKVVNAAATPVETAVALNGIQKIEGRARAIVLTSANATDENSLADPHKVTPHIEEISLEGPKFTHSFPGNSVTVLGIGIPRDSGFPRHP
jgi:alpha-L-arabinofuranosidase